MNVPPTVSWDAWFKQMGMIYHVLPVFENRPHQSSNTCWCKPALNNLSHGTIVIHYPDDVSVLRPNSEGQS